MSNIPKSPEPGAGVAEWWQHFEKAMLDPIKASPEQRLEMKKAFYAGIGAMMTMLQNLPPDTDEASFDLYTESLSLELQVFARSLVLNIPGQPIIWTGFGNKAH